eukprot:15188-Heterococcus_DN1.PRE.1
MVLFVLQLTARAVIKTVSYCTCNCQYCLVTYLYQSTSQRGAAHCAAAAAAAADVAVVERESMLTCVCGGRGADGGRAVT